MGLWDQIYNSRVWVFALALIWYVISLAVLEAHNEASQVVVFVLACIAVIIGHWYAAYLGYRLWYRLAETAPLSGRLPLISKPPTPARSSRDTTSLWAWIDCWLMMVLVWALWSQACSTLFHEVFDISTFHLSHNQWAAMIEWIESLTSLAVGIRTTYVPVHAAVTGVYVLATLVFKLYDMLVFAIAFLAVYETLKERAEERSAVGQSKKNDNVKEGGAASVAPQTLSSSSSLYYPTSSSPYHHPSSAVANQWPAVSAAGSTATVYWNQSAQDDLGLANFLNTQLYQQQQQQATGVSRPMAMQ